MHVVMAFGYLYSLTAVIAALCLALNNRRNP